ncbi:peptidyl-prolyl cis-trans isomerase CYP95 [Daucus carota subsp. sativus]|uniref:peptidyl-prolyl cis-trans isomerase CYP95 n=1 Tax=Daucus carota subsp. sativus TaxID=79200 RepID=UPI0007EFD13B|nr:PREDICTED: peptidyl-prolyl cis-trans isomerase CYP95-like isoform X1 [Daucus carota subsp. sativus]
MSKRSRFVFLDVSIDGDPNERLVFELFYDLVPKTAENFRSLCTGEKGISSRTGKPLHYKGTFFHRITKGSMAQAGDLLRRDGNFGESIYGERFPDERCKLLHDEPGLLSIALADRDARGSLFSITFEANHDLDRKHIVFGKLVEGLDVLKRIESCGDKEGKPVVPVKITKCGEHRNENQYTDMRKASKMRNGKEASFEVNSRDLRRKKQHKKSSKGRRKRRRYYTSDSDSSESETETSDSDSVSDSDISSSSDSSSSSDDKRRKRKRSRRDRNRRRKKRYSRRDKRRRRRDKRSKRKSKRALGRFSGSESSTDDDYGTASRKDCKCKNPAQVTGEVDSSLLGEREDITFRYKKVDLPDMLECNEGKYPRENGQRQSSKIGMETKLDKRTERHPDSVDVHPGKNRNKSISPPRILSRSSLSPKSSLRKSPSMSPRRSMTPDRSMSRSVSGSPPRVIRGSRSFSRSPIRGGSSPARSVTRSPASPKRGGSISPVSVRARPWRSSSRSPTSSPPQESHSRSPPKTSSGKSSRKLESMSPIRSRRSTSKSPVRSSRRSISRSSGRAPSRRSSSQSPIKKNARNSRHSYSRSPSGYGRRARSPFADRARSTGRSPLSDGLSKQRIKRERGFSHSNAHKYHSSDRSPVRSYRYSRSERDRYPSHRRSPRRYRTPPRERSPIRYRSRRSRTGSRSRSRSPVCYRNRRRSLSRSPMKTRYCALPRAKRRSSRWSRSRSLSHSRSPMKTTRYRASPHAKRRGSRRSRSRSLSHSRSPMKTTRYRASPHAKRRGSRRSRSRSLSHYSRSESPKRANKERSIFSSESPPAKNGVVSYGDGSPVSGKR